MQEDLNASNRQLELNDEPQQTENQKQEGDQLYTKNEVMQLMHEDLNASDRQRELEDEPQQTEDQKMKPEVNMQGWSIPYPEQVQEDLNAFNRQLELEKTGEKRRGMTKQLRDLEAELDEKKDLEKKIKTL